MQGVVVIQTIIPSNLVSSYLTNPERHTPGTWTTTNMSVLRGFINQNNKQTGRLLPFRVNKKR